MCEELELYALDALDETERTAFEQHLKACSACSKALPQLQETTAMLALAVPAVKPPARLKMAVLGLTASESSPSPEVKVQDELAARRPLRQRFSRATVGLVAAASVAAAFALGVTVTVADGPASSPTASSTIPKSQTVLSEVMNSPDSATTSKKLPEGGEVTMAYSDKLNKAVFSSKGLADLSDSEVYQIWLQNSKGQLLPAGSFTSGSDSLTTVDGNVAIAKAVGVTKEPKAGATQPSSAPVAFMSL